MRIIASWKKHCNCGRITAYSIFQFLLLFFLYFNSTLCFAQNKRIDSLQTLLATDRQDTNKVSHLYQLALQYEKLDEREIRLNYGQQALNLARELNFLKGIARASYVIGDAYFEQEDYPNALTNFIESLNCSKAIGDKRGIVKRLNNIGIAYSNLGNYPKALEYYFEALEMTEEQGDKNGEGSNLGNIGIIKYDQGEYLESLNYYFKAVKIFEKINKKNQLEITLGNIGNSYSALGNYSQALDYFFKEMKIAKELGDKAEVARCLGNIGSAYTNQGDCDKAQDFNFKALKSAEEQGDKMLQITPLGSIAKVFMKKGKFDEAEKYIKKAIDVENSIGALNELKESEDLLSQLYDTIGQHKSALLHYKKSIALRDSLFSQENKKDLIRKEMNYEFDKIKTENEKQKALAEEREHKQKIIIGSVISGLLLVLSFAIFILRSLRTTRKQKELIELKNKETEHQKEIIEEKNKDITDSINYAKRIQNALLRDEEHVSAHLPEHFILFLPKDIVSGDFYWGAERGDFWYFAATDCTGHGVPGAIMSMLGISFLNDIVLAHEPLSPSEILNKLRDRVIDELRQKNETIGNKDGMDISLVRMNLKTLEVEWAGANNPLNYMQNGELFEIKADKQPIGYFPQSKPFTNHSLQLNKGDSIYIYSDGYADQFSQENKKMTRKRLKEEIIRINLNPMNEQKKSLRQFLMNWKGTTEQIDDVCVIGVRL